MRGPSAALLTIGAAALLALPAPALANPEEPTEAPRPRPHRSAEEPPTTALRQIDYLMISPSRDIRDIVARYVGNFPLSVRILLMGIGALAREGRPLMSYLLFDAPYCKELMDLGYQDALESRDQILHLLGYDELIEEQGEARRDTGLAE